MLRVMTASLEAHLRRRYSRAHVQARVAQVDEVLAQAREHHAAIAAQAQALAAGLRDRLWLPDELALVLHQAKQDTLDMLGGLLARLEAARRGFAELPLDAASADDAPAPIALSA